MTVSELLDAARTAGLTVTTEAGRLVIRGPREAGHLARQLLARKPDVLAHLAGARCCGSRAPGVEGDPLVPACKLCPSSPTYWRDRPVGAVPAAPTTRPAPAGSAYAGALDWSRHAAGDPRPCRICRKPAFMRDADGLPCHKVCAEPATTASEPTGPTARPVPDTGACLTCNEPTSNRDRDDLTRCESCCAWLFGPRPESAPTQARQAPPVEWLRYCQCGHSHIRHDHDGRRNGAGPCHGCECSAFNSTPDRASTNSTPEGA